MSTALPPCSILILAGGRGARMGGADKGLIEWRGAPLISWVQRISRPLTDDLIISCNRNQEHYATYADRLIEDAESGFPGPLAGILAGLSCARHQSVLILPCDTPGIDHDLLNTLRLNAAQAVDKPFMLRMNGQWEPLFSVLPKSLYSQLLEAWQQGVRSPRLAFQQLGALACDIDVNDARLINLNTPASLQIGRQGT